MATEATTNWSIEDLEPYAKAVISAFGEDRLMYGSDWPVVELASEYSRWFETSVALAKDCSVDLEKLYRKNALMFYKIE